MMQITIAKKVDKNVNFFDSCYLCFLCDIMELLNWTDYMKNYFVYITPLNSVYSMGDGR